MAKIYLMGKCTLSGIHQNYCWAFPLFSPKRVPLPILGKLEKEITRLTLLDVTESVEEPTEWCAPHSSCPEAKWRYTDVF